MLNARSIRSIAMSAVVLVTFEIAGVVNSDCAEQSIPQVIHTRYEAVDSKIGGNFIIWIEQEKVWYGTDPRLSPAVRYVDVTLINPSPGSPPTSLIEVMPINSTTPQYFQIAGLVRFRVIGMILKSSNVPQP
jgi:hypothetical protein